MRVSYIVATYYCESEASYLHDRAGLCLGGLEDGPEIFGSN
jgi:hypothetical protein